MSITISIFDDMPAGPLSDDDIALHKLGIMKTIYVPVHPYVNAVKRELGAAASDTLAMYQNPHKRTQDRMHDRFFDTYINWSQAAVNIDKRNFPFQYPTNGSNEAIRESIAYHSSRERAAGHKPRLHIFEGEYEGYTAHAASHGVEVLSHDRDHYEGSLREMLRPGDPFYLSTPSGIDGNIWKGYNRFLTFLENKLPQARLMLDLAYLNTTASTPIIRTDSSVIDAIFISMSKSFPGAYYDRIGGMFSRTPVPGLYGNMWFKNLHGLVLGHNLMMNSPLGEIPTEMSKIQSSIITKLKPELGENIVPSDVTFVATQPVPDNPTRLQILLTRAGRIRYCLTPSIIEHFHP